mgnify:FL=1
MWPNELRTEMRALRKEIAELRGERDAVKEELGLSRQVIDLRKRLVELEISESKVKELHDREDRELRHMIGLEKKRQEFEIAQAKRETTVVVREENLAADKERFTKHLDFMSERFTKEVGYLKDLIEAVLERLPNVVVNQGGRANERE